MRSVVVTGIGHVGAAGDAEGLARALEQGTCPTRPVASRHHREGSPRRALLADEGLHRTWLDASAARRMSPMSRHAVAAARMAAKVARIDGAFGGDDTAVMLATTFAAVSQSELIMDAVLSEGGPLSVSPSVFTESVANAPAAQVAIDVGARASNLMFAAGPAGALVAVSRALGEIRSGRVRRSLAGVVDELVPLTHACLDRLRALVRPDASGDPVARPFDAARCGVVAGDGATVLVVETEEDARRRDAPILARLVAGGSAFDPTASRVGWGSEPAAAGRALRRSLEVEGWPADSLELIVAGASGSRAGDRAEARFLIEALGPRMTAPLVAPKGIAGEFGGGFLASAMLAFTGHAVAPTPFHAPDVEAPLIPLRATLRARPARALVTSSSAGGTFAWLMLEQP